jgi:predicted small secreted protein
MYFKNISLNYHGILFYSILKKMMKKISIIIITTLLLWACNGAGTDAPAAGDTTNATRIDSANNARTDSSNGILDDSTKTNRAKPDSTMRQ